MKQLGLVGMLVAAACGSGPGALLLDNDVQAALRDAKAKLPADDPCSSGCTDVWMIDGMDRFLDSATSKPTDPKFIPANLEGTWNTTFCKIQGRSNGQAGDTCAVTLEYANQGSGKIQQTNQGAASSGSGAVSFIAGNGHDVAWVLQQNHATSGSCSQDVVNLLYWGANSRAQGGRQAGIFTVIKNSTCPTNIKWQCACTVMAK